MLVGLLRTIIIIVIIWQVLKLIGRYVMPYLLNKGMQKVQRNMEEKMRQAQGRNQSQEPEGSVHVENEGKTSRKTTNDDVGEYVDFEEVE